MYRFKLKEIEVGDTEIRGGKKSTVTDIDPETGAISWDVADVADFTSTYKALQQAKKFLDTLEKTGKSKNDTAIDQFAEEIANLFNSFRTHVRKNYPKEYERVSRLKEEEEGAKDVENIEKFLPKINNKAEWGELLGKILNLEIPSVNDNIKKQALLKVIKQLKESEIDEGEGIGYLTPKAFDKNKKSTGAPSIYYYKLGYKPVPKKIKGAGTIVKQLFEYSNFQQKRIAVFDEVEDKINNILPMLSNAKNETAEFYNENPGSYAIVVPTDYILEILDEVELKLKQVQDK
tara:strand:- start:38 stop:907 length:870 start_codon:yes stop_codon:yes gene_type:complete